LATPCTFNPEAYFLYEKLIAANGLHLKYAFIELQVLHKIADENLKSHRNYYWHNLRYLMFAISYIGNSNYRLHHKIDLIKVYLISYLNKFLIYSQYKALFDHKDDRTYEFLGKDKNGFFSLNEHMEYLGGNSTFHKRSAAFKSNRGILREKILKSEKSFSKHNYETFLNPVHLRMVLNLIQRSEEKGIYLIFIIPPRLNNYGELLAIKQKLPKKNVIELADVNKYPELYKVDLSFDGWHLNKKGAAAFTTYLADEFKKHLLIK